MSNRIDFVAFVSVTNANPNGDPNFENRPRTNSDGYGLISDVCIKRKIRNRMQDMGEKIFYQAEGREEDNFKSLNARYKHYVGKSKDEEATKIITDNFIDNRLFGAVCAYKGTSLHVRGPVTVDIGRSIAPIEIVDMGITKSMNGDDVEDGKKKSSDTMGTKHMVSHAMYKICGSVSVELAEKIYGKDDDKNQNVNFEHDMDVLKEALATLFVNDESSARPAGSMEVTKLYWFTHTKRWGNCNQRKVYNSVECIPNTVYPNSPSDYTFTCEPIDGVDCEEVETF